MTFDPSLALDVALSQASGSGRTGARNVERLRLLHAAHQKRAALANSCNCYRVSDARADAIADVTVERYGPYAVILAGSAEAVSSATNTADALLALGAEGVYLKARRQIDLRRVDVNEVAPDAPLAGRAAPFEFTVNEFERRFLVRLGDGLSTGLFFDQRANRSRLQEQAAGCKVLNLFCYTGSFSVAAGLGGASQVVSVDSSRAALLRLDANLRLNQLPSTEHRVLKADCVRWLERATRRDERFDWVILDPPSFSSAGKKTFSVEKQYHQLAAASLSLLSAGGFLLAVTNHQKTSRSAFERILQSAAECARRKLVSMEWTPPPVDCPLGSEPDSATKSVLLRAV